MSCRRLWFSAKEIISLALLEKQAQLKHLQPQVRLKQLADIPYSERLHHSFNLNKPG